MQIKTMLKNLTAWGRRVYLNIFDLEAREDPRLNLWADKIKGLPKGARLRIESNAFTVPWGLLYDDEVPDPTDQGYFEKVVDHFWGLRYQVEYRAPLVIYNYLGREKEKLKNIPNTRLTVAINKDAETEFGTQQQSFFRNLPQRFQLSDDPTDTAVRVATKKDEVITSLIKRKEPQHLYYFFCHHAKGEKMDTRGYYDITDSKMIIEGHNSSGQGTISLSDLEGNEMIHKFQHAPVMFLNACESARLEVGDYAGFMYYFIHNLSAWAFIGSEAELPASFADVFGQRFVDKFLDAERIGEILFELNNTFIREHHNPFGLYYTLYGNGDVGLSRAPEKAMT